VLLAIPKDIGAEEWPADQLDQVLSCPLCGSEKSELIHSGLTDRVFYCAPGKWSLYSCVDCGAGYLNPRPSVDSLHLAYQNYYTHGEPLADPDPIGSGVYRILRAIRNGYIRARYGYEIQPLSKLGGLLMPLFPIKRSRADSFVRNLPKPAEGATLLDVGCANGAFLLRMRDLGWQVQGIEIDPDAAVKATQLGLDVKVGQLEEAKFPDKSFDAITLSHVVEHLYDPVATLKECKRILKPGGILWIATPNLRSIGHAEFKKDWRGLEPPRHLIIFNPDSLRRSCEQAGLVVKGVYGVPCALEGTWQLSLNISHNQEMTAGVVMPEDMRSRMNQAEKKAVSNPDASDEMVLIATRAGD
jgi:2-polyprenyl-3-methyl-5-hydroxy-6-metoxy-1,4-benzoquinol methylase